MKKICLASFVLSSLVACGSNNDAVNEPADDTTNQTQNDISVKTPPDDGSCQDPSSGNSVWFDNCVLKANGLYANSSYTLGVQRILWCLGYAVDDSGEIRSENTFVAGIYELTTETAVKTYQSMRGLDVHGAVGAQSWQSLQQELQLEGAAAAEYSTYSIRDGNCQGEIAFLQRNTTPQDWNIALNSDNPMPGNFSVKPVQ